MLQGESGGSHGEETEDRMECSPQKNGGHNTQMAQELSYHSMSQLFACTQLVVSGVIPGYLRVYCLVHCSQRVARIQMSSFHTLPPL